MVELFFLLRAQVRLGAGHPQQVAMHNYTAVSERSAVMANFSFEREGKQTIDPAVDEQITASGLAVEKV